jgi:tRNA pseudouridine13 synthase
MSRRSANWHRAWGSPLGPGDYKTEPGDFQVTEIPLTQPVGDGQQLWLWIEKEQQNTQAVIQMLARQTAIKPYQIGYAGRKDKQAISRQWLSLPLSEQQAKQLPDDFEGFRILKRSRHTHKLSVGDLVGNHFQIRLSSLSAPKADFGERLEMIKTRGFPNYFGPQRFGRNFQNLSRGERMLAGKLRVRERNQRSMYLSACRSYLFNEYLARRIADSSWHTMVDGDLMASESDYLPGTDLVNEPGLPLGWLAGDGDLPVTADSAALLGEVLAEHAELYQGIANSRVTWQTRPLVMSAHDLSYHWDNDDLLLEFSLPKGAFATSLLRELITIEE